MTFKVRPFKKEFFVNYNQRQAVWIELPHSPPVEVPSTGFFHKIVVGAVRHPTDGRPGRPQGAPLQGTWRVFTTFLHFILGSFCEAMLYFQRHTGFVRRKFNIFKVMEPALLPAPASADSNRLSLVAGNVK
jgi:hypothetical protein